MSQRVPGAMADFEGDKVAVCVSGCSCHDLRAIEIEFCVAIDLDFHDLRAMKHKERRAFMEEVWPGFLENKTKPKPSWAAQVPPLETDLVSAMPAPVLTQEQKDAASSKAYMLALEANFPQNLQFLFVGGRSKEEVERSVSLWRNSQGPETEACCAHSSVSHHDQMQKDKMVKDQMRTEEVASMP